MSEEIRAISLGAATRAEPRQLLQVSISCKFAQKWLKKVSVGFTHCIFQNVYPFSPSITKLRDAALEGMKNSNLLLVGECRL